MLPSGHKTAEYIQKVMELLRFRLAIRQTLWLFSYMFSPKDGMHDNP
jgi:hypothetical protein